MRTASITGPAALSLRMSTPEQVDATIAESTMPAYMEMFLAHLRLLVGVPFEYLVPDSRLLPDESIRWFYLDRSWTDRLVDGAIAVGKTGTREQAHHQAHADDVRGQLDLTERSVRYAQRGTSNQEVDPYQKEVSGGIVTGFLLRSAAVSGWPAMDVRAFKESVPASSGGDDPNWAKKAQAAQLTTLRLERLSPSVLLGLFDGVPELVWFEEPHHAIQFGITTRDLVPPTYYPGVTFFLDRHEASGQTEPGEIPTQMIPVPVRAANQRVVAIQELRKTLYNLGDPNLVSQTGSAAFAIEMLTYPWRQRFEGAGTQPNIGNGAFVSVYSVAKVISNSSVTASVQELL